MRHAPLAGSNQRLPAQVRNFTISESGILVAVSLFVPEPLPDLRERTSRGIRGVPGFVSAVVVLAAVAGCDTGESVGLGVEPVSAGFRLVDADLDQVPDSIDLDGDGGLDLDLYDLCASPLVDSSGGGFADAVDLDCDGQADFLWCAGRPLDLDFDGIFDGVDADCDGGLDVLGWPADGCAVQLIDTDGSGLLDSADLDCDGAPDLGVDPCRPIALRGEAGAQLDLDCDGLGDLAL